MGGSAADTPATPEYLRASDEERDRAISALRQEFVEGRLSQETFMFRVQSALGARHRGQLTGLFTDLPPHRLKLLDRIRAVFRRQDPNPERAEGDWYREPQPPAARWAPPSAAGVAGWPPQSARWSGAHGPADPGRPAPMVFPPGQGTSFTIGRTQDCDLRIADPSVSRRHAQLDRWEAGWLLSDLGSHNGTRVNGWLVREPVPVRPGDILQFGSATFVIQAPPGPDRPPASAGPHQNPAPPAGAGPHQDPEPPAGAAPHQDPEPPVTAGPQQERPDPAVSAGPQRERPDPAVTAGPQQERPDLL